MYCRNAATIMRCAALANAFFLAMLLPAMTPGDLPNAGNDRTRSAISKELIPLAEPLFQWRTDTGGPLSREPLKRALYASISLVATGSKGKAGERLLFQGLLWHYLYQLGIDSAFAKADDCAGRVMAAHAEIPEAAWLKGVNLLAGLRIRKGLLILDSLRSTGAEHNPDFLRDYMRLSARYFLPFGRSQPDSFIVFMPNKDSALGDTLQENERVPFGGRWEVQSRGLPKVNDGLPIFTFTGTYTLLKPFPLSIDLPRPGDPHRSWPAIDALSRKCLSNPLRYDPEAVNTRWKSPSSPIAANP